MGSVVRTTERDVTRQGIERARRRRRLENLAKWIRKDLDGTSRLRRRRDRMTGQLEEDDRVRGLTESRDAQALQAMAGESFGSELDETPRLPDHDLAGDPSSGDPLTPWWMRHPVDTARRSAKIARVQGAAYLVQALEFFCKAVFCLWFLRGAARCAWDLWCWASDAQGRHLAATYEAQGKTDRLHEVRQDHDRAVARRQPVAVWVAAAVVLPITIGVVWSPWSFLTRWVVLAVTVTAFGWVGRPKSQPIFRPSLADPAARRITPDRLEQAFIDSNLASPTDETKPGKLRQLTNIVREANGVGVSYLLPGSVSLPDVVRKKRNLAASLDVPERLLHIGPTKDGSEGRAEMFIADRDPFEGPARWSALLDAEWWDFWQPVPFGIDVRGRGIPLSLIFSPMLIGGAPRMGKSNAMMIPTAAAALDPYTRIVVLGGRGGPDWAPFRDVAWGFSAGVEDDEIERSLDLLERCWLDIQIRNRRMREGDLPADLVREGQVVRGITHRREYDMPLVLIVIDDAHNYFIHPRLGKDFERLTSLIIRNGQAVGYTFVIGDQKPDKDAIPTSVRSNCDTRFALRTNDLHASDAVLSLGSHGLGFDSSTFVEDQKGVGILKGAVGAPAHYLTMRTHKIFDTAKLGLVTSRGRALRMEAGTLSGAAAEGVAAPASTAPNLIEDVLSVLEPGEDKAPWEFLARRLATFGPRYRGLTSEALSRAVRDRFPDLEITSVNRLDPKDGIRHTWRGPTRRSLEMALAQTRTTRPIDVGRGREAISTPTTADHERTGR